jgi:hypothetical protein
VLYNPFISIWIRSFLLACSLLWFSWFTCCGSECFPSRIPDHIREFTYFNPKNCF